MLWRFAVALIFAASLGVYQWLRPAPPQIEQQNQPAQLVDVYQWERDEDWFGGFSGLELTDDGKNFYTITDRGHIVSGRIVRDNDIISGVIVDTENILQDDKDRPVVENRTDAEGLALQSNGKIHVSFERVARIWIYTAPDSIATWASYTKAWRAMKNNGGLEMLAIDKNNVLYTLPEVSEDGVKLAPVYRRLVDKKWDQPFSIPLTGRFLPVGGDFGPDGRLYLLERDVYPFGFRSRVRAFTVKNDQIVDEETVLETPLGLHGNLEGIAVWQDVNGIIRLTMIADDNFLFVQDTEIVEYALTE